MQIKSKDKILELMYAPTTQQIGESSGKHDVHTETYVTEIEGKHYKFRIFVSYNNGIEMDEVDLVEVKPEEKTVIEWKEVS